MIIYRAQRILPAATLALATIAITEGFAPITPTRQISAITHPNNNDLPSSAFTTTSRITNSNSWNSRLSNNNLANIYQTKLHMADNENEGPGLVTAAFIVCVLLFFVVSAFAPLIDFVSTTPMSTDLNLGDSVVTRQDSATKLKNYQSKFDALSPAKIQEKLANLPVFYVSSSTNDGGGAIMGDKVYTSYTEAEAAAKSSSPNGSSSVKVTTLDQVMYPLILKREMSAKALSPIPTEIKTAKESAQSLKLIPSAAAISDAKDTTFRDGIDIPLFVVERLAFAGNDGRPQLPLFTEKGDAITSYARLREGGSKLPEEPTIRTTTLVDVLDSMEKGTRPAVGQLQFYGNADDVMKADEIMSQ